MIGLGSSIAKPGKIGKRIVRDGLVLKHDYNAGAVEPVSSGAASFNGTSDYIAINAKPVDTADGTYCFWANSSETGSNAAYFAHGGSAVGEFTGNFSGTGKPLLYLKSDLYQYWVDTGFADDGKWHHWALIVDVDDMTACKLYIDGVEIAQDPGGRNTSGTVTNYGNLEIGRKNTSNEFEGYLCNFGVWNVHLTQAQVKSIMNKNYAALSASEKEDLVSWWNLDSTIPDAATLVYDNHHGGGEILGSDLTTPLDFTTWLNTAGTTSDITANAFTTGGSGAGVYFNLTTNKVYKINVSGVTGDVSLRYRDGGGAGTVLGAFDTDLYFNTSGLSSPNIYIRSLSATTATVTSVSVKLVNGNTGTLS